MATIRHWLWLPALLGLSQSVLAADFPSLRKDGALPAAITRAAQQAPDPQQAVAAARDRLAVSLQRLEGVLDRSGAAAREGWNAWLGFPTLEAELARTKPDVPALRVIEDRLYRNQPGLELPSFVAVRRGLKAYLAACEYAAASSPREMYGQRLQELAGLITRLDAQPDQADAHAAGTIVAWMESLSQEGAALARSIRARYSATNAELQISARLINVLLEQNVQERHFVSDMILGSVTQGPAFSSGQVSFGVVPSQEAGTLEVRLRGQTLCPANVATRGQIAIYSSAHTALRANKQVRFYDQGLLLAPATAWCQTEAEIHDVEAGRPFIERLAWRRAHKLLPEAEAAAARHAESQASAKLDERADAALGGVNDLFRDQIRAPLIRWGALPTQWQFWSDERHLRMALVQSGEDQLAVAEAAPKFPAEYDLALCAHESMIDNFCQAVLGGATVKDQGWLDLMNLLTGSPPRPLWVHDRAERWSVTFADKRPLTAQFSGQRITLALRLAGVTRGQNYAAQATEIEARYAPQVTREGPALIRDGDLAIRSLQPSPNEDQARSHEFLSRKFGAVFPEELHFSGLVPPTGGSLGKLRQLTFTEFGSTDRWVSLAYQLTAADPKE